MVFKSIFHKTFNLISLIVKSHSDPFLARTLARTLTRTLARTLTRTLTRTLARTLARTSASLWWDSNPCLTDYKPDNVHIAQRRVTIWGNLYITIFKTSSWTLFMHCLTRFLYIFIFDRLFLYLRILQEI